MESGKAIYNLLSAAPGIGAANFVISMRRAKCDACIRACRHVFEQHFIWG
jgi:hypothetical protein